MFSMIKSPVVPVRKADSRARESPHDLSAPYRYPRCSVGMRCLRERTDGMKEENMPACPAGNTLRACSGREACPGKTRNLKLEA